MLPLDKLNHPDFGLDGVWSLQTTELMKVHSAEKIELNKWWALTAQNWTCPSCGNGKRKIARKSENGILLAKLVSHHDHVAEIHHELRQEIGEVAAAEKALKEHIKRLARGFLARFEPTIVCEPCNNIEPEIKKCLGLPSYLSLSPWEIGFMRPAVGNTPSPEIRAKTDKLLRWCESMKKFIRLSISEFCAEIHERQVSHIFKAMHIEAAAKVTLAHKLGLDSEPQSMPVKDFLKLSTSKPQGDYSKSSDLPTPSQAQFENYIHPSAHRRKHWEGLSPSWRCPICGRSKFECFRSSPKTPSKFNGNVFPKRGSQISVELSEEAEMHICQDCNDFPKLLGDHLTKIGRADLVDSGQDWFLNSDVVRRGIVARSHQRHTFNFDEAVIFLDELLNLTFGDVEIDL